MGAVKQTKGDKVFNVFNITILSFVLIIVLYPLIYMISASFSDPEAVIQGRVLLFPKKFNIDAYIRVFKNPDILIGYRNTSSLYSGRYHCKYNYDYHRGLSFITKEFLWKKRHHNVYYFYNVFQRWSNS